ncbi:MAG: hypothetical protein EA381_20820 [Planctomycetaceae bacterium]|nr:MAG: hypothetical protein EA381_20820 [Planctomycetaceae bacterium]
MATPSRIKLGGVLSPIRSGIRVLRGGENPGPETTVHCRYEREKSVGSVSMWAMSDFNGPS